MAWTQADLDAIDAAILKAASEGWAEVRFGDRMVKKYTAEELLKLRDTVKGGVSAAAGGISTRLTSFSKG